MAYSEQSSDKQYDYLFKLVLVGDTGVGKSCLMMRFADETFPLGTTTTVGVDFKIKTIEIRGKTVKLQIWDTAGQERFRSISTSFYHGAHGIIVVYSITDKHSFESIPQWIRTISGNAMDEAIVLLLGNKCDMDPLREVGTASAIRLADKYGFTFLETSAKESTNVNQAFVTMATQIKDRVDSSSLPLSDFSMKDSFQLQSTPVDQTYCCSYF